MSCWRAGAEFALLEALRRQLGRCYDEADEAPLLKTRQIIPPLTARGMAGQAVRAGDFKQKKNLVIAFLDANCPRCQAFLRKLAVCAWGFAEREAVALVVYAETPAAALTGENLPAHVLVAVDLSGRSLDAYLGEEVFGPDGLERVGVFVADRYGELYAQSIARGENHLPGIAEVLEWLEQIQVASGECGVSYWASEP